MVFAWTSEHDTAFQALQRALTSAPVLVIPDFSKLFSIQTDACATGVGAVLLQQGHPLAYLSKSLGPKNQGLSTYEKEYLAIILAVNQWRSYLQHGEFLIFTDQKSLVQLNEQRLNTAWQQKVYSKLIGLQYKVVYKKGSENNAADALSRRNHSEGTVAALSISNADWLDEVIKGYQQDSIAQELITQLAWHHSPDPTSV